VLLLSGAAAREHQHLKAFLGREAEAKRVELTVCLQPPPGKPEPEKAVDEAPPARALPRFPNDLAGYEVVVAIDPDWGRLSAAQARALEKWVKADAGGLVLVAGTINLPQLAGDAAKKLRPVAGLVPVVLADARAEKRDTTRPWRLGFPKGKARPDYLKLDAAGEGPLAGWDEFFRGGKPAGKKGEAPEFGFYSCYPVKSVRRGAVVLATFGDPKARLADGQDRPYLVRAEAGKGRVVYVGSGEVWRVHGYRESFYERFWSGLLADAARR
jgi:hypothetical protein